MKSQPVVIDNNRGWPLMGILALTGNHTRHRGGILRVTSGTDAGLGWSNGNRDRIGHRPAATPSSCSFGSNAPELAPFPFSMFDQLLEAMRGLTDRSAPDERRRVAHAMKEALVHHKLGLQDLRAAIVATERKVAQEREELATVERRLGLAAQIDDQETVAVAERFRAQHAERLAVMETKLMSQQQELKLGERELEEMTNQMRRAMSGLPINSSPSAESQAQREVEDALSDDGGTSPNSQGENFETPRLSRAEKEAAADDRLAELKRRMGK
jgi:hypothetical protein